MGKNKTEKFIFTLMMCACMVLGMTIYNMILIEGFSSEIFSNLLYDYWPGFIVALILDLFIVGKIAKYIAGKFIKDNDPVIKRILIISFCMVCGMVLCMSFYGAFINVGFSPILPYAYINAVWKNFIVALPLNLLIVSPFVRSIFLKLYPEKY